MKRTHRRTVPPPAYTIWHPLGSPDEYTPTTRFTLYTTQAVNIKKLRECIKRHFPNETKVIQLVNFSTKLYRVEYSQTLLYSVVEDLMATAWEEYTC